MFQSEAALLIEVLTEYDTSVNFFSDFHKMVEENESAKDGLLLVVAFVESCSSDDVQSLLAANEQVTVS